MKIKPIPKFLKLFLGKDIVAITLCPFGIYNDSKRPSTLNHEKIHWQQQLEMLIIFFYIWYLVEWLIRLTKEDAYMNISFEREAYANDYNLDYLNSREPYSWVKYLIKK